MCDCHHRPIIIITPAVAVIRFIFVYDPSIAFTHSIHIARFVRFASVSQFFTFWFILPRPHSSNVFFLFFGATQCAYNSFVAVVWGDNDRLIAHRIGKFILFCFFLFLHSVCANFTSWTEPRIAHPISVYTFSYWQCVDDWISLEWHTFSRSRRLLCYVNTFSLSIFSDFYYSRIWTSSEPPKTNPKRFHLNSYSRTCWKRKYFRSFIIIVSGHMECDGAYSCDVFTGKTHTAMSNRCALSCPMSVSHLRSANNCDRDSLSANAKLRNSAFGKQPYGLSPRNVLAPLKSVFVCAIRRNINTHSAVIRTKTKQLLCIRSVIGIWNVFPPLNSFSGIGNCFGHPILLCNDRWAAEKKQKNNIFVFTQNTCPGSASSNPNTEKSIEKTQKKQIRCETIL